MDDDSEVPLYDETETSKCFGLDNQHQSTSTRTNRSQPQWSTTNHRENIVKPHELTLQNPSFHWIYWILLGWQGLFFHKIGFDQKKNNGKVWISWSSPNLSSNRARIRRIRRTWAAGRSDPSESPLGLPQPGAQGAQQNLTFYQARSALYRYIDIDIDIDDIYL